MSMVMFTILAMIASFAICGIPFGLLVAKAHGVDVRKEGSGNIGMTNVARTVGGGAAALTFVLDVFKGTFCVLVARLLVARLFCGGDWALSAPQQQLGWIASSVWAACVFGHVFSPYLGFHGGKGISVGAAIGLMIDWRVFVCIIATFLIVAFLTKKVSLGSICAAVAITIFSLVFHVSTPRLILAICAMCLAVFQHRGNIDRLRKGTEPDFKAADSKTKK